MSCHGRARHAPSGPHPPGGRGGGAYTCIIHMYTHTHTITNTHPLGTETHTRTLTTSAQTLTRATHTLSLEHDTHTTAKTHHTPSLFYSYTHYSTHTHYASLSLSHYTHTHTLRRRIKQTYLCWERRRQARRVGYKKIKREKERKKNKVRKYKVTVSQLYLITRVESLRGRKKKSTGHTDDHTEEVKQTGHEIK